MNAIPGLPVAVVVVLAVLAVATPWLLPDSRARAAWLRLAVVAALWSATAALLWQQVPLLAPLYLSLSAVLAWQIWRLVIAVLQLEPRRRWALFAGRVALGVLLSTLLLWPQPLAQAQDGSVQWLPVVAVQLAAGWCVALMAWTLAEWVWGLWWPRERARLLPWGLILLLLLWGIGMDLVAGAQVDAAPVPPLGSLALLLGAITAWWLIAQRAGPFPLLGEIPRNAFSHVRDPLLLVDGAQRVQAVTPAALDLLGRSYGAVIGQRLASVLPGSPEDGAVWDGPLWLADHSRPDGGLWVHTADMHSEGKQAIARVLHLRSGLEWPAGAAQGRGLSANKPAWIEGAHVAHLLDSALQRYGMGRQNLAASLHVNYDWSRVQQEHGEAVLHGLLERLGQRLREVCDWQVDCLRLRDGQFLLLITDLTGGEEVDSIITRAQSLLREPFVLARKKWALQLQLACVPDLRLYRHVDDWLGDAQRALRDSRGQCVSAAPRAERRASLTLALEKSLINDGLDWRAEPVLNVTTREVAAWRLQPHWTPEPDVDWEPALLRQAVEALHMERALYQLVPGQLEHWAGVIWLPLPLEHLAAAHKGLREARPTLCLELDRLDNETLRSQGLRASPSDWQYVAPTQAGRGFGFGLEPRVLRLDAELCLPGLCDDLSRQALVRGCRAAAKVRNQRLYAPGIASRADLRVLRELGVDYASGPAIGLEMSMRAAMAYSPPRA
jgi:PAS domain-containing protein/GGDEF domain-containing protein